MQPQIFLPIFYFLFCFFIFVNLREGEKNPKKQIQKKKIKREANTQPQIFLPISYFLFFNPKKKDKKRSKYVAESVSAAHFWGAVESASQRPLIGRNALSRTDGRMDGQLCKNQTGFPGVLVPDENAFPYGRFRSKNIKNDYAAERHVTDRQEDQVNLYIR